MTTQVSRLALLQYSLLALPLAFAGLPLYIHMPDFYVREFGLGLGTIGFILLAVRLFDAIQDPLIGYWSDRFAGYRSRILLFGLLGLTIGLFALFWGPQLHLPATIWFAMSILIATTGFSIVVINLNMLGGFWSEDTHQRTRIASWRESFTLLGLLAASLLPTILTQWRSATTAFQMLSLLYLVLMLYAGGFFWRWLRRDGQHLQRGNNAKEKATFRQLLHDGQGLFFATYLLTQIAAAIPAVLVLFFIRDYLQAEQLTGLFLLLYFLSASLLLPIWFLISTRINKYNTWLLAMLLSVLVFAWVVLLQPGDVWAYGAICVLSGFALGAELALPASIVADRVTAIQAENRATLYYGVMAFIPKLSLALASGFAFFVLAQQQFLAGEANTDGALQSLVLLYGLAPCLVKVLAIITLWMLIRKQGGNHELVTKRSHHHGLNDLSQ